MRIKTKKQWQEMKKRMIQGLHCVLCEKPAETLHHPTRIRDKYEYWNDKTQIPVCYKCHEERFHITKIYPATDAMKQINPNIKSFRMCRGGGFD